MLFAPQMGEEVDLASDEHVARLTLHGNILIYYLHENLI
jgi:hypothetical protein